MMHRYSIMLCLALVLSPFMKDRLNADMPAGTVTAGGVVVLPQQPGTGGFAGAFGQPVVGHSDDGTLWSGLITPEEVGAKTEVSEISIPSGLYAMTGAAISVPISVKGNAPFAGIQAFVNFDPSLLTYLGASPGSLISGDSDWEVLDNVVLDDVSGRKQLRLVVTAKMTLKTVTPDETKPLAVLQFKVNDTAQGGAKASLAFVKITRMAAQNGEGLPMRWRDGDVSIGMSMPTNLSVTPSSATSAAGTAQTFAATYSDSGGWRNLTYTQLWVTANGSLSDGLSAEYHAVDRTLWLYDAQTGKVQGGYAPGSSNVIATANGSLDCSKSTVSGSGNNLTVSFNLTPNANMSQRDPNGAGKTFTLKLWCMDANGAQTGYDDRGAWTVNNLPSLTNVGVTPSSAMSQVGQDQTFAATYSASGGWQNILNAQVWVTANNSMSDGLDALYSVSDNTLWLIDANGRYGGYAPGSAHIITSANGSLDCSRTTVSGAGSNLTVSFNLKPNAGMGGKTFTLFLWCQNRSGATAGFDGLGTWTVQAAASFLTNVGITPSLAISAVGSDQTFTATYCDSTGSQNLSLAQLWVTANKTMSDGLDVLYNAADDTLWMYDASGAHGGYHPGERYSITTANGSLNCLRTKVERHGNYLTVSFNLTPSAAMDRNTFTLYLWCRNQSGAATDYDALGKWSVIGNAPSLTNVSVSPAFVVSATGAPQSFAATYRDSSGYRNLTYAQLWVTASNSMSDGLDALYSVYDNTLWLSDANGKYGGYAPGSSNVITTVNGSLDCSKTTVSGSGNNLTVSFNLTPNAAMSGKTFAVKLWCQDRSGTTTDYDNLGTWIVNASSSSASVSAASTIPSSNRGSVARPGLADVALTRFSVIPNPALRNDSLTLSFTVKNLGERALKDVKFVVMESGKPITKSVALPALAKGEAYTGSVSIAIPRTASIGDHFLTGVVSTASSEINTDNNSQTVKLTVK